MDLGEAVKAFEAEFARVVPVPDGIDQSNWGRCTHGERFLTVVSYGLKPDGAPMHRGYPTPDAAIEAWLEAARKATEGNRGTLYWRHPPECEKSVLGWLVYSRFVSTEA